MAKIIRGFQLIIFNITTLPPVFDGGQAKETVGRANRGNQWRDPEDTTVEQRYCRAGVGSVLSSSTLSNILTERRHN